MTPMAPDAMAILDRAIADVRSRFVARSPEMVEHLDGLIVQLEQGQDIPAALNSIAAEAHKVAGVARTIGLQELGISAAQIERLARAVPTPTRWDQLAEALIPALEDFIERLDDLGRGGAT